MNQQEKKPNVQSQTVIPRITFNAKKANLPSQNQSLSTSTEDCPQCRINVATALSFELCKKMSATDSQFDCQELRKQYDKGEITADQLLDLLISKTTDPKISKDLLVLKKLMNNQPIPEELQNHAVDLPDITELQKIDLDEEMGMETDEELADEVDGDD